MRLYLDTCLLNRPLDDLSVPRNRLEAEALMLIMEGVAGGNWILLTSEVLELEIAENPDRIGREAASELLSNAAERIEVDESVLRDAREIEKGGIGAWDALHISAAIRGDADVFLTVDDRLYKKAARMSLSGRLKVALPLEWLGHSEVE